MWPETFVNNDVVRSFVEALSHLSGGEWVVDVEYGVNKDTAFERVSKGTGAHITVGHSTYEQKLHHILAPTTANSHSLCAFPLRYWGTTPTAAFFASIPFGLGAAEFAAWVSHGGGRQLWEEHYDPYNMVPLAAGDTGMQMGGWFPKPMSQVQDFQDLRMRIEGLGGPVLQRLGTQLVAAPASKLVAMLDGGELDACEFATPMMDEAAGIHKLAKPLVYHYPGWHQPSAVFEFLVNADSMRALTLQQRALIRAAALRARTNFTQSMLAGNRVALDRFLQAGVRMHRFPTTLLEELKRLSDEVVQEHVAGHELASRVHSSYRDFQRRMEQWGPMSDAAMWSWRDQ